MKLLPSICLALAVLASLSAAPATPSTQLWYRKPAEVWTEALPIGNGSLGAMIFGGVAQERLQVNQDTLWSGQPHEYQNPTAHEVLPELRRLLAEGKQKQAEDLAMERFMSVPLRQMMYQPFCDVWLDFSHGKEATDYRRELDLNRGISTVRYQVGGTSYTRETFSSYPAGVLVQKISASGQDRLRLKVRLSTPHTGGQVKAQNGELDLTGQVTDGAMRFAAKLVVAVEGGSAQAASDAIEVSDAKSVTLVLSAHTNFVNYRDVSADPVQRVEQTFRKNLGKTFDTLLGEHIADYQKLFDRVKIDLGSTAASDLPTDERLEAAKSQDEPGLAALLFNYGRYLLISSSRPGAQPANLQGIWNHQLKPAWGSKYTTNINLEMNYWPAEVANLSETAEPLWSMIDDLVESGRKTAKAHYGANGWVLHHNTDLWRGTAPINHSNHGIWPTGGAWLCLHLWERYRFTGDTAFLRDRAYPVMKEASQFFVETLVEDKSRGWLISGPSNSPEQGGLVMGPAMDHQMIRGLFGWTIEAAEILGVDADFARKLSDLRAKIAPNLIGKHGQLQEWLEDVDDPSNKHRHVSHLWGVFPGEDITWQHPDFMKAAQRSLEFRGDGGTGWSLGWKISLWARLKDGDHAHLILKNQLKLVREDADGKTKEGGGTYPNLFDAHPPFQIDGNFAATAGVIEMLMQSHPADGRGIAGEIVLLPALPSAWSTGSIQGIRARGGVTVNLAWKNGVLTGAALSSDKPTVARVRYKDTVVSVDLKAGTPAVLSSDLKLK